MRKIIIVLLMFSLMPLALAAGDNWLLHFSDGTTKMNGTDVCIDVGGSNKCLSAAGTGGGDITEVNTDGPYLSGGATSGAANLLLNETYLNATIDDRASGSENSSWNESYADTLYYSITNPSTYWNDTFATFNKTYADTLYADISVTGDNSSWNETYASTLFPSLSTILSFGYYNSSDFSITDYFTKTDILGFNYYNSSDFSISDYYLNSNPANYWNSTWAEFNKTYADTLYADISVTGDNSSWNQTLADSLYLPHTTIWDTLFNNTLTSFINSWLATKTTDDLTEGSTNLYDNSSWNETLADSLYVNVDGDTMLGGLNMTNNSISDIDRLKFNVSACNLVSTDVAGILCYDENSLSLSYTTGLGNVIQIGSEQWGPGRNKQGSTVYNGQVTTLSGGTGGEVDFVLADASNASRVSNLGVITLDSCNDNAICAITTFGLVRGLNTSGWNEGDKLYLSDDGSGNLTNITPTFPNFIFHIATVVRSHATEGSIVVFPTVDFSNGVVTNSNYIRENLTVGGNMTVNGYIDGQPLDGALDSGVIWAESFNSDGNINITHSSGLNIGYPNLTVRLAQTNGSVKYCDIAEDTIAIPDNAHTVYYIDQDCVVQNVAIASWLQASLSPGGVSEIFNAMAHSGSVEVHQGAYIQNKVNIKIRKNTFYTSHLEVVNGFAFYDEVFPNFTVSEGQYTYILDVVTGTEQNISDTDEVETFYYNGTGWVYNEQHGINITYCQDGVGTAAPCTNVNRYRRYNIYVAGYTNGDDSTEIHQELADEDTSYVTLSGCLDTVTNSLILNTPDIYDFTAVPLYSYCSQASAATWNGQFIDLREVKTGSASSAVDTGAFLNKDGSVALTGNWDQGAFNLTNTDSWFLGKINASRVQDENWIEDTQEDDLNVNSSDYWDTLGTFNSTQMEDSSGELNIKESWFTTLWNSIFGTKTTDDLTEGTTNLYENSSWNESLAKTLYADISVTGDNSSWNESHADTLYAPVNYGDDWNKTYADTLYEAIDHTHPASEITAGTFGTGNYIMDTNLTVEKVVLETNANHYIEDNSTCTKIYGSTSVLEIC